VGNPRIQIGHDRAMRRRARSCLQAQWILEHQRRAVNVAKPIPPTRKSNRINLRVSSRPRIVLPEVVVMQVRLIIKVLPRVAQVQLDHLAAKLRAVVCIVAAVSQVAQLSVGKRPASVLEVPGRHRRLVVAKRAVRPLPHRLVLGVCHQARGVQVVAVHGMDFTTDDGAHQVVAARRRAQLERFRALEGFNTQDQETVIKLIDAMIVKQRVESAMQPVGKSGRRHAANAR